MEDGSWRTYSTGTPLSDLRAQMDALASGRVKALDMDMLLMIAIERLEVATVAVKAGMVSEDSASGYASGVVDTIAYTVAAAMGVSALEARNQLLQRLQAAGARLRVDPNIIVPMPGQEAPPAQPAAPEPHTGYYL